MKITIGLPVYNGEEFLEDTLRSIQNQTHRDWELIIVDDGSTDRTEQIVRRFMETDSRISFHKDGLHKNRPDRNNDINALTTTPYLVIMDADDIMHPQRLEKQLAVMEAHPEIDQLSTNAYCIDRFNNIRGSRMPIGGGGYRPWIFIRQSLDNGAHRVV